MYSIHLYFLYSIRPFFMAKSSSTVILEETSEELMQIDAKAKLIGSVVFR